MNRGDAMQDLIDRFCGEYHVMHGVSHRRRLEQRSVLRRYEEFSSLRGRALVDTTADDLLAFLLWRIEEGQAPSMVLKMRNMIRPLFTWAADKGLVDQARADAIQAVKSPQANKISDLPRPYSRRELDAFYEALHARWPTCTALKMQRFENLTSPYRSVWRCAMRAELHAMVGLALYCGLRREEVFRVSLDDIDPINAFVIVQDGKGGEPREVPYPDELRKLVTHWLGWRARIMKRFGQRHSHVWLALWPNQGWGPGYTPAHALGWRPFQTLLKQRVGDGWTWHPFRHTCGTEWLRAGVPVEKVQRLLGHSTLEQTMRYARVVKEDVAREMARSEATFHEAVAPREAA